mgnify:CR=1 FL=1
MIIIDEVTDSYIYAISIFIFFLIFKTIFRKTIIKILENLVSKTTNTIDDKIIYVLRKPIDWFFIVFGVKLALDFIEFNKSITTSIDTTIKSLFTFFNHFLFCSAK